MSFSVLALIAPEPTLILERSVLGKRGLDGGTHFTRSSTWVSKARRWRRHTQMGFVIRHTPQSRSSSSA
jgi:hypothetical protein